MSWCRAPRVHWLSMSSAVIWTDWASQLSNKDLSKGKDFDKPEGRQRGRMEMEGKRGSERGADRRHRAKHPSSTFKVEVNGKYLFWSSSGTWTIQRLDQRTFTCVQSRQHEQYLFILMTQTKHLQMDVYLWQHKRKLMSSLATFTGLKR